MSPHISKGRHTRREFEYKRHGTTTLIAALNVGTGQLQNYVLSPTRTEVDYYNFIEQTTQSILVKEPNAHIVFLSDQLNTHLSESLVIWAAQVNNVDADLGIKGQNGLLKNLQTRMTFLENDKHHIRFVFTPKHCSWLNPIENWFAKLQTHVITNGNFSSIENLNLKIENYIAFFNKCLVKPMKWKFKGFIKDTILTKNMPYRHTISNNVYVFKDLKTLLAKASPLRSGDVLAGVAASNHQERIAAQIALADVPLKTFLNEAVIPYEEDDVTRLIIDTHNVMANGSAATQGFESISHFTVGQLRDWLLSDEADTATLLSLATALTPEMVAAVSKLMRNQDLIAVAQKCEVITRFRNTLGLKGHLSTRLQPNHPTDNIQGIAASIIDGLLYGSGDAVIGINPATDSPSVVVSLLNMIDDLRLKFNIPTQSCVLCHVTTALEIMHRAPVDLVFQSIGGSEKTNKSFGVSLTLLEEAYQAALSLNRGSVGNNVMYFETGQGSSLSANAHHGVDQQTLETRAYAVARQFNPLLVNTVVGFIGPEYLFDGKQIIRAALEDHFCGKLMGLPMGVDICYTNHAEADQDDMDNLLTLLGVAGCNYIMGIPGSDDIMLNYQSTSFHDALYVRKVLNKRPAPEFEKWLMEHSIIDEKGNLLTIQARNALLI